jgi:DNA-binding CsgD family transcriptional regulator
MSARDIEFQEAVRCASERYKERKRALKQIWERAQESPDYALSTARDLAVKSRYRRRRGRRYLYSRFGVKIRSRGADTTYAAVQPERSPRSSRERLLRAEAVVAHAEWEAVWRAVWMCRNFEPAYQARMSCKFACEAMRQSPALWGFFIERDLEPDDSVRQHAAAQLGGWLDNEVRLFRRTRETGLVSTREEKLAEIATVAAEAWGTLQPDEPFWLPNTYVRGLEKRRQKGSLAGRGSSLMDAPPDDLHDAAQAREDLNGIPDEDIEAFVNAEDSRRLVSALLEKAHLSERESDVIQRDIRGEQTARVAAELGITKNQVGVHRFRARAKLRRAAGL